MRVLILGYYYSSNLGDAIICECLAAKLQEAYPAWEITIADLDGRNAFRVNHAVTWQRMIRSHIRRSIRHAITGTGICDLEYRYYRKGLAGNADNIKAICDQLADLVIFAGGQLFMDGLTLQVNQYVRFFEEKGTPVIFNACGVGPACGRKLRKIYHDTLMSPCVRWISCRDDAAFVERYYLNGQRTVARISDPGLWAKQVYGIHGLDGLTPGEQEERNRLRAEISTGWDQTVDTGRNGIELNKSITTDQVNNRYRADRPVGLGVMFPDSLSVEKCIRFWIRMIRELDQRKVKWQIFTNGREQDSVFVEKILSRMPEYAGRFDAGNRKEPKCDDYVSGGDDDHDGRIKPAASYGRINEDIIAPIPRRPQELPALIQHFSGIISFRLHSHVIACSYGIPSIALVWDHKLNAFFEQIGHPERCLTIDTAPETIWQAYLRAESEGYPEQTIQQMKENSFRQLCEQIDSLQR